MSFAQAEYLPFLALVLAVYAFVPARARSAYLCLASIGFYAWWQPMHAPLLLASILVGWGAGLALCGAHSRAQRNMALWGCVLVNLGLLVLFKYADFFAGAWNALASLWGLPRLGRLHWTLPLGLSFFTFQGLGYAIDVWRGQIEPCRSLVRYALYITFFPQLVAGPIERAGNLLPQLARLSALSSANAWIGARSISWGLFKKWVMADRLRALVWPVYERPSEQDSLTLLVCALALNAILYLDFSAYTDIARGSARLFGVELVHNFLRPFASRSLGELAQRWHVSLYTWIRDYAFAPLAARARGKISHATIWRNNLLVMGLFGLWHGASVNFLLWGLASGATISCAHSWRLARTRAGVRRSGPGRSGVRGPRAVLSWAFTLGAASLFFVLFFSPSLEFSLGYYARLCTGGFPEGEQLGAWIAPVGAILIGGLLVHLSGLRVDWELWWTRVGTLGRLAWLAMLVGATILLAAPQGSEFIYFRF